MVIHDKKSMKYKKFNGNKRRFDRDNYNPNKKPKRECWRCGKIGHFKKDCGVKLAIGNKDSIAGPSGTKDPKIVHGATSHVCKDFKWFEAFEPLEDGSVLRMGNVATEPIKELGKLDLYLLLANN